MMCEMRCEQFEGDCLKARKASVTCALYSKNHPANFRVCNVRREILNKKLLVKKSVTQRIDNAKRTFSLPLRGYTRVQDPKEVKIEKPNIKANLNLFYKLFFPNSSLILDVLSFLI